MKTSESISKISPALLAAQKEITNPKRTHENPFYKSSYAPLNEIITELRPIYNKHGISIMQDINKDGCISTMLLHESGEWIQQEGMFLPLDKQTPQGAGSAFTYGRRYTLEAMAGIASEEDDDGNGSDKKKADTKKSQNKAIEQLNSLPEKVKEGFKHLGYKSNQVWQFCEDRSWNNDKIMTDINKALDSQIPA